MACQLYLFSHAGGNKKFFENLIEYLNLDIIAEAFEYKGRGERFGSECYKNPEELLDEATQYILDTKKCSNIALLGYSLGSTVCYKLYDYLKNKYNIQPVHIFFMANAAPYVRNTNIFSDLSKEEFWKKLNELGGMPQEFFEHEEIMDLFYPILKSDVMIEESCQTDKISKIDCDISIISSSYDLNNEDIMSWKKCANKTCNFYEFDSSHFFMNDYYCDIARIINKTLIKYN